ncbi:MAG TPA: M36 family metallopeptidase [Pyrinomonadaceae bacterium]
MCPAKKRSSKATRKAKASGTKTKASGVKAEALRDALPEPVAPQELFTVELIKPSQVTGVTRDPLTGAPRKIRGDFALPTATFEASDTLEDNNIAPAARAFLEANAEEIGLKADENSLRVTQEVRTPINRVVHFQQLREGIPVVDTSIVVQVDDSSRITQIDLGQATGAVAAKGADARRMTIKRALKAALVAVGEVILRAPVEDPQQVYYPTVDGLKLAYQTLIMTRNPAHDWRVIIDAYTGQILEQKDLLFHIDGEGLVFDPNPVVTARDNTLRDPAATIADCGFAGTTLAVIDAERATRTLKGLTFRDGAHRLEGPFVRMRNFGPPDIDPPAEADANDFKYSSDDERFVDVMVYYHVDTVQRYIQSLGINTAHNRPIEADAHDGSGGAWFSPGDLALHFGDSGPCKPPRGEEADAIIHEYGHAIQNNQVPGWGGANPINGRNETRAMGEGFGDILACVFLAERGAGFQREVFEDWVYASNATHGLRRVDGAKVYPADWLSEEHADGEIWSAALWNIYRATGGDSSQAATREAARDALLKTLILSHHAVAANASMPDGAEALMNANAALPEYRGRFLKEMLDSFHERGLLRSDVGVDLWIKDGASDEGDNQPGGPLFAQSPDLWIRNANDNGATHQNPELGRDNWFYARVRNRGAQAARAFVVTFNVKPSAATPFVYPADWLPFISATVGYNLAPGASVILKARWPQALLPPVATDACLLASVYAPVDPIPSGLHAWQHNNLALKSLTIVDAFDDFTGDTLTLPFQGGSQSLWKPD